LPVIYSIGHSNHSFSYFLDLLRKNGISLIVDVRSVPFSRYQSHWKKNNLQRKLDEEGIAYQFVGKELGGKRAEKEIYDEQGWIIYDRVRRLDIFQEGLCQLKTRVEQGHQPALLCAEKDPWKCHCFFLIAPALMVQGFEIRHIMPPGHTISQKEGEERFLLEVKQPSLFHDRQEILEQAYRHGGTVF